MGFLIALFCEVIMLDIELTDSQSRIFAALSNLYIGPRGSGRTFVIAYFLVKKAMHRPKIEVSIECSITDECSKFLFNEVVRIINGDSRFTIDYTKNCITFMG